MKAILMSIKPKYVSMILNKEKTIEVRKRFPKDYVGWVYIYCCAEDKNGYLIRNRSTKKMEYTYNGFVASVCWLANRKVVARFWCDKVEEITPRTTNNFTKDSCLTIKELEDYLWSNILFGYAIHITKLEIFDKPKELSDFKVRRNDCPFPCGICNVRYCELARAPQSWCYIEI